MELYGTLWNFMMGLVERNNYGFIAATKLLLINGNRCINVVVFGDLKVCSVSHHIVPNKTTRTSINTDTACIRSTSYTPSGL